MPGDGVKRILKEPRMRNKYFTVAFPVTEDENEYALTKEEINKMKADAKKEGRSIRKYLTFRVKKIAREG